MHFLINAKSRFVSVVQAGLGPEVPVPIFSIPIPVLTLSSS